MQMIATSRMRRAQEQALASRPYAAKAWEILTHLAAQQENKGELHPMLTPHDKVENIAVILITSDKGLAGAYNHTIIRETVHFLQDHQDKKSHLITVGRKGRDFMMRHGWRVLAEFTDLPARPKGVDISPISRIAIDGFMEEEFDAVYAAYTNFINTLTQKPTIRQLLPITAGETEDRILRRYLTKEPVTNAGYLYEPSPTHLLNTILPRFTELQLYQAMLESLASEHSARMVAMRNATDNANDLIDDLTLSYNKARQEAITKEMLDIAGGAEALG